jgi:hypothetical protein
MICGQAERSCLYALQVQQIQKVDTSIRDARHSVKLRLLPESDSQQKRLSAQAWDEHSGEDIPKFQTHA